MKSVKFIVVFLFISNIAFAQDNYKSAIEHEKLAFKNYLNKRYDLFLVNMKKSNELRPNHPRLIYNLAAAYALNKNKKGAIDGLRKLINMKLYYSVDRDSDFVALWKDADFKNIVENFKKNLIPTDNSKTAFKFPEKDLITESVAYDSVKKIFYLGSIYKRKIVWRDENGNTGNFKNSSEDGLWSVFGIKVDPGRRVLWVCTAAIEQTKDYNKNDLGKSAVLKYNIDSKELIKKYKLDDLENEHLFGDLTLSSTGDVYISDSRFNAVYKILADSDKMEMFLEPGRFVSLQGLDLSDDKKYLFLADYSLGLYKINLINKKIEQIKWPLNFTPLGIDGLYFYKNSLIVTQNGINPQRVVRIYLNNVLDTIENYTILEANNPYFNEITLGVIKGDYFYYIANSQWGSFDKNRKIFPAERLKKPRVLKIKLTGN